MKRILIVDDLEENRYLLQILFQHHGDQVELASNGVEALALARQNPPDLIVSDILMPVMDGFALCREWKRDPQLHSIPLVFYTATYTDPKDEQFALDLGADAFIVKPAEPDVFMARIAAVLAAVVNTAAVRETALVGTDLLKQYNQVLIYKLEQKLLQLEASERQFRQSEQTLLENEARLRAYIEQAADALFVHEFSGRFLEVNQQACASLGYSRDELLRMSVFDVETDFDLAGAQQAWSRIQPNRPFTLQGRQRRKDGSTFPVEVRFGCFDLKEQRLYLGLARDISERLEIQRRLADRELELSTVIETEPECVKQLAQDGSLLYMNRAGLDMIEADSLDQVLGQNMPQLVLPAHRKAFMALIQKVFAGETGQLTFEIQGMKGSHRWLESHAVPLRDSQGRIVSLLGLTRDITQRKQVENALLEARDRNQHYLDTVQSVMVALDDEGRVTMLNRRGCELLGVQESELLGLNWFASCLPQPEGMTVVYPAFLRIMTGEIESAEYYENTIQCSDGGQRLIAWHNAYLRDAIGKIVGTLSSGEDITEHKAAEEKLRLAAAVFEHSTEGVMITDAKVDIVAVNPAFTTITGYSEADALGKNPKLLQSGRHDRDFYRTLWGKLNTSDRWQGEVWNRRKDGGVYPELLNISAVRDERGQLVNYLGVLTDISDIKHVQEELDFLAHHDPLTALPNRNLFNEFLQQAIQRAIRGSGQFALLFMDLDRFKDVNDSLGHPLGDKLLVEVAQRLKSELRGVDALSRIGGDEFNLLLDQLDDPQDAGVMAERLLAAIAQPFKIDGHTIYSGTSIGIAIYPRDGNDIPHLHRNADTALYLAKAEGRGTYRYFAKELAEAAKERQLLETLLRQAMHDGQLELHYQPQVTLSDGNVVGVEALARWNSPTLGAISPVRFIPLAEETGLIVALGDWALNTACQQMRRWIDAGSPIAYVAVNVSAVQLARGNLVESVRTALAASGIEPWQLELEITESFVMSDPEAALLILNELKVFGVKMAIDDFGTGYSSLAYLKRLPVNRLKVDQSFVRDMLIDANDAAIVRAVIGLGHSLGLDVLAEGVETEAHAEALRLLGCDSAQGWHYGRPSPAD